MTKPRAAVPLPEPFQVVFEQPKLNFFDGFSMAYCRFWLCHFDMAQEYGVRQDAKHHWCSRGERVLVIWEAL